jgi:hypothetical protein
MNQSSATKAMSNSILASGPINSKGTFSNLGKCGNCCRREQGKQCCNDRPETPVPAGNPERLGSIA